MAGCGGWYGGIEYMAVSRMAVWWYVGIAWGPLNDVLNSGVPASCNASLFSGMVGLAAKWVRLAPNGINLGLFQIRFQCIWRDAPNALKSDLKTPQICPIWGQSDPLCSQTYHPWHIVLLCPARVSGWTKPEPDCIFEDLSVHCGLILLERYY